MFKKAKTEERPKTKIEKRVELLPTAELVGWTETTLYGLNRNISDWQKSGEPAYLDEAKTSLEALVAIVNALRERAK